MADDDDRPTTLTPALVEQASPSEWGLLVLAIAAVAGGVLGCRRRRARRG
jgi:hypothetical protein